MSAPLPSYLRQKFREHIEQGLSARAAALSVGISPATGVRWAQKLRANGNVDPLVQGRPRGEGKLAPYQSFMKDLVERDPGITLFALRDQLAANSGLRVHHSSISNSLHQQGFKRERGRWRVIDSDGES